MSRPVGRILSGRLRPGDHLSRRRVTATLQRPTRRLGEQRQRLRGPEGPSWSCSRWGLPSRPGHPRRWWALTPPFHPYPHLTRRVRPLAVCSLWHCPARRRGWVLPTIVLCGVRTFLGAAGARPTTTRPPGRLIRRSHSSRHHPPRSGRVPQAPVRWVERKGVVPNIRVDTLTSGSGTEGAASRGADETFGQRHDPMDVPGRRDSLEARRPGAEEPFFMLYAFLLSTAVIFVAELGDKSQLMALTFATRFLFLGEFGELRLGLAGRPVAETRPEDDRPSQQRDRRGPGAGQAPSAGTASHISGSPPSASPRA